MEVLLGVPRPPATVVDLSRGAPRSTTALPDFSCQVLQAAIPAAICSGVEFANISETLIPLKAPSERYKTRYLFMHVRSYYRYSRATAKCVPEVKKS